MEFAAIPELALSTIRRACETLPEVAEVENDVGVNFTIRRRIFAYLFSIVDPDGRTPTMLVVRADPDERLFLLAAGHPFFAPNSGKDRVGVVLDDATDWSEIAELVTESYRLNAPKKLAALVEHPPPV